MGGKLGTLFARAGHEVVFSYARSERKLERLARQARGRARAGTPAEAARDAEALLLAVHWSRVDDVLQKAGDLSGKVIVSCSLPMNASDTALVIGQSSSGAEELAKKVRKARIVAAFSSVPSEVLFSVFDARRKSRRPSLVYCGDDRDAHSRCGFRPGRRRRLAHRPLHGTLHPAHRPAGLRDPRRSRTRVSLRAVREVKSPRGGCRYHRQLDEARLAGCVIDAFGCLVEILRLRKEDVRHERLGVAVVE